MLLLAINLFVSRRLFLCLWNLVFALFDVIEQRQILCAWHVPGMRAIVLAVGTAFRNQFLSTLDVAERIIESETRSGFGFD
jgi:hypothetical protein